MLTFLPRRWATPAALAMLLLSLFSCSDGKRRAAPEMGSPAQTTYKVRGVIREVNVQGGTLEIQHEEIPGYMPAMTMPFNLRNPDEASSYQSGQAIAFDFVVTKDDSWITNIRKLESPSLHLPPGGTEAVSVGHRLKEGDFVPGFALLTQQGEPYTQKELSGQQTLLTFIFTRCPVPTFCPLMSQKFVELQKAIEQTPELSATKLLSITIDPGFDTPKVLASYAKQLGANPRIWTFATGQPEDISRLTSSFAVHREVEGGSITHSLATALVDKEGVVRRIWRGNFWKPAEVLRALQEGSALASSPPASPP